ncbi:MAG: DoxX-like family protein [Gallionella sp.]|nr:DoxX-like family protein [Gallionella sp.]
MRARDLMLVRYSLATVWLVTGVLSLGIFPQQESLALLGQVGLHENVALFALYGSAVLDIALGLMTLALSSRLLWLAQAILVLTYSAFITAGLPEYWLHPFGPVLKNLPILMLLWLLYSYEEKTK